MTKSSWLTELTGIHTALAAEGHRQVQDWEPDGLPPLTILLGALARAYVEHAAEFAPDQRRKMFAVLEQVLDTGSETESTAVATGFFESLLHSYDRGFDLKSIWSDIGPKSREYCLYWNDFWKIPSPNWMA